MGIRVAGVGAYVPERTVSNAELAHTVDTSHEWIVQKTGIHERRLSRPDEAPSDMGCRAAERCLRHAGVDKAAIDWIIVACTTPDQSQPAVACMLQQKLGIAEYQTPAFDVNSVCAGFVPLTLSKALELGRLERGSRVLLCGFGGGLSWGAALFRW